MPHDAGALHEHAELRGAAASEADEASLIPHRRRRRHELSVATVHVELVGTDGAVRTRARVAAFRTRDHIGLEGPEAWA